MKSVLDLPIAIKASEQSSNNQEEKQKKAIDDISQQWANAISFAIAAGAKEVTVESGESLRPPLQCTDTISIMDWSIRHTAALYVSNELRKMGYKISAAITKPGSYTVEWKIPLDKPAP